MCSQNAGNATLETRILKIIWGCPQTPPSYSNSVPVVLGSHLGQSHIILGKGGQGKQALWQFCPTTEESLKNALTECKDVDPRTLSSPITFTTFFKCNYSHLLQTVYDDDLSWTWFQHAQAITACMFVYLCLSYLFLRISSTSLRIFNTHEYIVICVTF